MFPVPPPPQSRMVEFLAAHNISFQSRVGIFDSSRKWGQAQKYTFFFG